MLAKCDKRHFAKHLPSLLMPAKLLGNAVPLLAARSQANLDKMNIPSASQLAASCHRSILHPPISTRGSTSQLRGCQSGNREGPLSLSLVGVQLHQVPTDSTSEQAISYLGLAGPPCWIFAALGCLRKRSIDCNTQGLCDLFCLGGAGFSKLD